MLMPSGRRAAAVCLIAGASVLMLVGLVAFAAAFPVLATAVLGVALIAKVWHPSSAAAAQGSAALPERASVCGDS